MSTPNHFDESVKSRFDDIIRDGPNIYTALLEIFDNMIEWGNSENIQLIYNNNCPEKSRPFIEINDHSEKGFITKESIDRFFTLGKLNQDASENTIGKYGKGGYKAIIAIADIFELTTHIEDKIYSCGTNFRTMESQNTFIPTIPLNVVDNSENNRGSIFKIYFRFDICVSNLFTLNELKRHTIRAYHNISKQINFNFISEISTIQFSCKEYSPYEKYVSKNIQYINFNPDNDEELFILSSDKNEYTCAKTESYILKDTITSNDLLGGNKVPGIDFYRNNRMCNTKYPISKIGNVGTLLQKGQMRGKRCHITTHFNDKKVTETKSFDDFVGVTTVKDIYEDDRMEKSLINIFEQIAEKCAIDYEEYINRQKLGINKYLSDIKNYLSIVRYNDELLMSDTILEIYKNDLTNYTNHKLSYYDENEDKILFAKNKQDVELQKKNGNTVLRKNSGPITQSIELLRAINDLLNNKAHLIHKRDKIQQISNERNIGYIEAENIYNIQEKALIEQNKIKEENKKKLLQREIDKIHAQKQKKEAEARKLDIIKEKEKQAELEKKKNEIEKQKIQKLNDLQLQVKQISIEELQKVWINYMMNK